MYATSLTNQSAGLVINSFNAPITSLLYGYSKFFDQLSLSPEEAGEGSCRAFPFCAFVNNISTSPSLLFMAYKDSNGEFFATSLVTGAGSQAPATVPVPATLFLIGLGLAGIGFTRRKTRLPLNQRY